RIHPCPRSSRRHASETPFQLCGLDHQFKGLDPVDGYNRYPLPVTRFKTGIAGDVDLLEVERMTLADGLNDGQRLLAQMTAGLAVESQARHATSKLRERRWTAFPPAVPRAFSSKR